MSFSADYDTALKSNKEILPAVSCEGLNADGLHKSAFLKERATIRFHRTKSPETLRLDLFRPEPQRSIPENFQLRIGFDGQQVRDVPWEATGELSVTLNVDSREGHEHELELQLLGTEGDNWKGGLYKWLGKLLPVPPLSTTFNRLRRQRLNRFFRIRRLWVEDEILIDYKNPREPINPLFDLEDRQMGINIMGWFRGRLGIGESARSSSRACDAVELPNELLDLKTPCLADMSDETLVGRLGDGNPFGVNLVHINPPESHDLEHYYGREFFANRYNIAYWAWELPEFPDDWVPTWRYYNEVWCPSRFVADAVSRKVPLPVVVMPHAVKPELEPRDWRAHFGFPADQVLFLFAFDFNSYLERKNPMGLVEAFRRAFPDKSQQEAGLVLKYHSGDRHPNDLARLKEALSDVGPVYEISESLPREAVTGLQAACDVFVSLHRSEGFGLNLAECMALGKPVIATDWSGSAEFVKPGNSIPVPYQMVELRETHGPYEAGQIWAEPDLDAAAKAMRTLVEDPALRERLGKQAQVDIERWFSPNAVGNLYRQRLKWIQTWFDNPEQPW